MLRNHSETVCPIAGSSRGTHHSNVPRQSKQRQQSDSPIIEVHLPPRHAVAGGDGVRVMIVVPAFAAGQKRHPPVIG